MRETGLRHRRTRAAVLRLAAALSALALCTTACAGDGRTAQDSEITVLAAASLTDVFEDIAEEFTAEHPETAVEFNFAGSSELAVQINSGADADVFAAADRTTMDQVVRGEGLDAEWAAEHGGHGAVFATNTLQIAVPSGNPAGIDGVADLAGEDVDVAFCAEAVPCGEAADAAMTASGADITPVTLEEDVRAVLTKVELGEVDAGLVYATDVQSAEGRVDGIDFPEAEQAVNEYPVGVLAGAADAELAADWVAALRSEAGTEALDRAGFGTP